MIYRFAGSGLYGFNKSIQNDIDSAIRKLERFAQQEVRSLERHHPEAGTYLNQRVLRSNCPYSKTLLKFCVVFKKPTRISKGPLGFKPATVKACARSIANLLIKTGEIAYALYTKQKNHYDFLNAHIENTECSVCQILLESYPILD